jgi:hypothetical protein
MAAWERVAILLIAFGIACCGVAVIFYSAGFLIRSLKPLGLP